MQRFKQQKGNAVIGILLVLVVLSFITIAYYKQQQWQRLQTSAKGLGYKIAMVVDALEKRLSFDEKFLTGNYTIKDLINKSCGGTADDDYLPCGFSLVNDINNGDLKIAVTQSKTNAQIKLACITTSTIGILNTDSPVYKPIGYLAGVVLTAAQATKAFLGNQYLSASASYSLDRVMAIVTADIVVNQNNSTIYLRVDGSNKMQNALSFNKELNAEHRMVKYLSSITNDGDLTVDAHKVILGNQSGTKGDSNVVVNDLTIHSMGDQPLTSLLNSMPVGAVVAYAGSIAPNGFFECNGASFSYVTYPKLYQALGVTQVPDLRGQFVRGWDHGRGLDNGRGLGSYQADMIKAHTHTYTSAHYDVYQKVGRGASNTIWKDGVARVTGSTGGSETRPHNIALMYIIKHD